MYPDRVVIYEMTGNKYTFGFRCYVLDFSKLSCKFVVFNGKK